MSLVRGNHSCLFAPYPFVVFLVKRFIKRSLATLENYDEWKERRRVFNPAFTQRFDSLSLLNNKYD